MPGDPSYRTILDPERAVDALAREHDALAAMHGADAAALSAQIEGVAGELRAHIQREESMCRDAFPDGDIAGHRRAHEAMIRATEAQERFWSELRLDIAKKGVWGLLIIVIGLVAVGAASKLGVKP